MFALQKETYSLIEFAALWCRNSIISNTNHSWIEDSISFSEDYNTWSLEEYNQSIYPSTYKGINQKPTRMLLQKQFLPIVTSSTERRCRGALFNSRQALQSSETGHESIVQTYGLLFSYHLTIRPSVRPIKQTNKKCSFKNKLDPLQQVALRGGVEGLFSTHVKHFNHRKQGD